MTACYKKSWQFASFKGIIDWSTKIVFFWFLDLRMGSLQRCLTIPFMAQWVHHEEVRVITLLQMLSSPFPKQTLMLTASTLFRPLACALSRVQKPNPSHHQPQTPWAVVCNRKTSPRSQWCLHALKGARLGLIDLRCLWSLALVSHKSFNQSPETTETALSFHPSYGHKQDKANPKTVW